MVASCQQSGHAPHALVSVFLVLAVFLVILTEEVFQEAHVQKETDIAQKSKLHVYAQ